MVKASRSGSQKADSNETQAARNTQAKPASQSAPGSQTGGAQQPVSQKGNKQGSKNRKPQIGGTAVPGAKSTRPKELSVASPANQQAEYYNRDMRRRMEHMGTGPYSERAVIDPRERRKKRKERLQERQDRIKQLVDAKGPSRDVRLGRRNTLFLVGAALLVIILIVIFIIIRHPF